MSGVDVPVEIPRKIWTREDAHTLADLGFPNASKLELINGDLIDRMGKKRPHVIWLSLLATWLRVTFGDENVESESPTDVANEDNTHSEPEPDLKVLRRSFREYSSTNPLPEDLLLVIEVSDSTLQFDLQVKAALYARAKIIEYWVIDIPHRRVHVHRDPAQGAYSRIVTYGFNEEFAPLAKPDALFCMERL